MNFLQSLIVRSFTSVVLNAIYAQGNSLAFYRESCNEDKVILDCRLDLFNSPITWRITGLSVPISCSTLGCVPSGATINGNTYSFSANNSGSSATFNLTDADYGINWICNFNSTNYEYTISDTCGSTPSQPQDGILVVAVVVCVCGIIISMIILYVIYRCSNKNCKTHEQCWWCPGKCYSDFQLVKRNSSEVWNIEHYCLKPCCQIKECNKKCCSCFLCCGCCLKESPEKCVKENSQPLTTPPKRRKKKKKKSSQSANENNDDLNPPVEKSVSLDSLNSKSNKIHPAEDEQVNDTK